MTFWSANTSFGCFAYIDGRAPERQLLDALTTQLDVGDLQASTKVRQLRWSKYRVQKIDTAIADDSTRKIAVMVGTPDDVRLAGAIIRSETSRFEEMSVPALAWLAADSERWPHADFTQVARSWLRIAAGAESVLSGGILAACDLRNAKVEMTNEFETYPNETPDTSPGSFRGRMLQERPVWEVRTKVRRVYPTTLLGPRFAERVSVAQLADAGASNIEEIAGSIIFDATPTLLETWSPEYLAATVKLRRLLWPLSFQNPADDPDPPKKKHLQRTQP